MMAPEPLFHAFLSTLARDGIHVHVADYRRIALAFSTERDWSHASVRATLASLIVKDSEESRIFEKRFDTFFHKVFTLPKAFLSKA